MGRQKKGDRIQVTPKLPANIVKLLDEVAKENKRDRTAEILQACEEYLFRSGKLEKPPAGMKAEPRQDDVIDKLRERIEAIEKAIEKD